MFAEAGPPRKREAVLAVLLSSLLAEGLSDLCVFLFAVLQPRVQTPHSLGYPAAAVLLLQPSALIERLALPKGLSCPSRG